MRWIISYECKSVSSIIFLRLLRCAIEGEKITLVVQIKLQDQRAGWIRFEYWIPTFHCWRCFLAFLVLNQSHTAYHYLFRTPTINWNNHLVLLPETCDIE